MCNKTKLNAIKQLEIIAVDHVYLRIEERGAAILQSSCINGGFRGKDHAPKLMTIKKK